MKKLLCALFCTSLLLAGCSSSQTTEEKTDEPTLRSFGKESETAYKLTVTNSTGQAMKAFNIEDDVDHEKSEILTDDEVIDDGEQVIIYLEPSDAKEEQEDDEIAIRTLYIVSFTLEDDSEFTLMDMSFDEIDTFKVKVEEDVAYITYKDEDDKEQSTLDAEKELIETKKAEEEAAKKAEEEAQAAAAAQQETVTYDTSYNDTTYYDTSSNYTSEPSYDTSSGTTDTSGSSEGCLDGAL